jgi:transcriptional regulator with XRE-family HTH domain
MSNYLNINNAAIIIHCQAIFYAHFIFPLFFMNNFGERLKKAREGLSLDQKAFGMAIGVAGRDTISRWERGLGFPSADILNNMWQNFRININWLISGVGEPFFGGSIQKEESTGRGKILATDPVMQLLNEEEKRAGITLTQEQRTAILKILRELVDRDVRSIRDLLRSIPGGKKKGDG